jgi:RNA polymerase subunit RPABC4/transcription elongation factor Spt4
MKCSNCGREFGEGTHCQHCGVDRVTGLANYNGYNNSGDCSGYNSSNYGASSKATICFACGEIIPANSEFCPYCSKQLYVTCPKCGNTYSSQYPACNKCGTNRESYHKQQEAERQKAIREEEERQRQQREWEQSPEGKAERTYINECKKKFRDDNSNVGTNTSPAKRFFIIIGIICLFIGATLLFVTISEHGSDNFGVNEGKELEGYGMSIVMIIMGGCFLFAEKMD